MLGKRIKDLRNEKGLTQEELGNLISRAKQTVSGYESGDISPNNKMVLKLADIFGVSYDYITGRTDVRNDVPPKATTEAPFPPYAHLPVEPGQTVAETIKGYRDKIKTPEGHIQLPDMQVGKDVMVVFVKSNNIDKIIEELRELVYRYVAKGVFTDEDAEEALRDYIRDTERLARAIKR